MLVNLKEILQIAEARKIAIGSFNTPNLESVLAVIGAAEELDVPVIIMHAEVHEEICPMNIIGKVMIQCAKDAKVPVCVHLDHGEHLDYINRALEIGFTSVMYDASEYPFEENVRLSKEAADYAHKYGATVEAELGHVGDGIVSGVIKEDGNYDNPEDYLTNPEEMKRFIAETGVDCLAVAVGTSHGVYVHEPKLDFERLELLNSISDIPMVVHGGSGTPDDQIKKAISLGVTKLNIYSEMMAAYFGTMKEELEKAGTMAIWMSNANREPLKAVKKVVKEKIRLTGSAGKA